MELILIFALGIYAAALGRRVTNLENQIKQEQKPVSSPAPVFSKEALSPIPPPQNLGAQPLQPIPVANASSTEESTFVVWIKKDFFVKLGALLLLIAFGWFVSYAFANNWIGPWGRVILGLLSGALVFGFGAYRITSYRQQGGIFVVLGSAVIIMSLWAAREMYGFFTPTIALIGMIVPVVLAALLSVKHRMPDLALASFLIGTIAPFFTASPEPSLMGLSIYLLMLVIGTLWVAFLIDAPKLTPAAILAVAFWSFPYLDISSSRELTTGLLFAFAFTSCFFVSNVASLLRHHASGIKTSHILAGLGTGTYLYFWIAGVASGAFESLLYAAWMALFILGGFFVYSRTKNTSALYLYGAVALAYLVALTESLFSGVVLTVIYAVELALLIVATRFIPVERRARQVLSWLYVPLCLVALQHVFADSWQSSVFHKDFGALLAVTVSLLVSGISLRKGLVVQQHLQASRSLLTAMSVSLLILFWLILHAKLSSMLADTMFFLTVSVVSVLMYSIAVRLSLQAVRWGAGILAFAHIILIGLSFDYIGASSWENGLFHLDAAVLLAITISFWLATALVTQRSVLAASVLPAQVLSSVAGLYTLTYVWLLLHSILTNSVATTFSLITYTVIGLALFIYGRVKENQFIKIWGAVLLCGVVLRLLFVEIWALSLTMRIVTFFVVGILLISTAFIGRKKD